MRNNKGNMDHLQHFPLLARLGKIKRKKFLCCYVIMFQKLGQLLQSKDIKAYELH